jgi:sortase B
MDETPNKAPKKGKKKKRTAFKIIMLCLIAVMLVSGWRVFTILKGYLADRSVYDKVSEQAGDDDNIDFDALREINPDVIGWLRY